MVEPRPWLDVAPDVRCMRPPPLCESSDRVQHFLGQGLVERVQLDLGGVQPEQVVREVEGATCMSTIRFSWYQSGGSGGVLACCVELGSRTANLMPPKCDRNLQSDGTPPPPPPLHS
ncbi:hypothetical protein F511_44888 [Dorcoceras hygrometricum]|uniref:Uncharacterized protein n=1 Tax=Dorcoceras hygrometricum TaxID=472368 RepID=A0A2Z7ARC2_9LAMI|nr:hypothetical protein F511_44888 [Dorcoceras hygrometricum]